MPRHEQRGDWAYVAFALRVKIAILLARADYDAAVMLADHSIRAAEASGDEYVIVQVLNVLGAVYFDRAADALREGAGTVAEIAARHGFRSATTFALEYRKRFGTALSRTRQVSARERERLPTGTSS